MKIEINAGGLLGGAIADFQSDINNFSNSIDKVIDAFAKVKTDTYNLTGGVGNLQGALDAVQSRIAKESAKKEAINTVKNKTKDFIDLAINIDAQVAQNVNINKEEFYTKYPDLRPFSESKKAWYEKAADWICDKASAAADSVKKAWNNVVEFCKAHTKEILLTLAVIVGAVLAVVAIIPTGGLVLVPMLSAALVALGVSAATAASIATAISMTVAITAGISAGASAVMDVIDIWSDQGPMFNKIKKIVNITRIISGGLYNLKKFASEFIKRALSNGLNKADAEKALDFLKNGKLKELSEMLDLDTPENGAIFWSGGNAAKTEGMNLAEAIGGKNLNQTPGGNLFDGLGKKLDRFFDLKPDQNQIDLWRELSREFAKRAKGDVYRVIPENNYIEDFTNVWNTVENPTLLNNLDVKKIIIHTFKN